MSFFDGEFAEAIDRGMNVTEALGWSCTFMKTGLRLFLLALYQGDTLSAGIQVMNTLACRDLSFSCAEYGKGLDTEYSGKSEELFWECVGRWKKSVVISANMQETLLRKTENWISLRTEGILRGGKR